MKESEKIAWVNLLTQSNTRPFVPKTNRFKADFFQGKFLPSFVKVLHLKGLQFEVITQDHDIIHAPTLQEFDQTFLIKPIHYTRVGAVGFLVMGESFISEALHKLLGGSDQVSPVRESRPLTKMETRTMENFDAPLKVSLREGFKGLLGLGEPELGESWDKLKLQEELAQGHGYFRETFIFQGLLECQLQIYLRISAFN